MKRQLLLAAFNAMILFGLTAPGPSWGFELDDRGHGGITRDALQSVSVTLNGETLKFTDRAMLEIRKANFEVDQHQLAPEFHFDDETLGNGSQRINTLRARVITAAISGDGKAARAALGAHCIRFRIFLRTQIRSMRRFLFRILVVMY